MRTGDIVLHRPSGEEWVVAWADSETGYMAPCGWPLCQALISECDVMKAASDADHITWVDKVQNSGRYDAHKAKVIAHDPH